MKQQPTILVVDDDQIMRKLLRVTLTGLGYTVLEAKDGCDAVEMATDSRPDLLLLDLVLPDIDGLEVARRLRVLPGGTRLPIIIVSGFLAKLEQARQSEIDFADYLAKPVEPGRLLQSVQAHLHPTELGDGLERQGQLILVAHDDPIQSKLLRRHLEHLGFRVETAKDGVEALEQARRCQPDGILTDVLMPRLDGFGLCQAVRTDPCLARVPVILLSVACTEEEYQQLAGAVGADALVAATPDFEEVKRALLDSLGHESPERKRTTVGPLAEEQVHTVIRRLEQQAGLNTQLTERLQSLEAQLVVLASSVERLTDMFESNLTIESAIDDLLRRCLDVSGASQGAGYLIEPDGRFSLRAQVGYPNSAARPLRNLFGHPSLRSQVLAADSPFVVSSYPRLPSGDRRSQLREPPEARPMLIVPLRFGPELLGALVFVWPNGQIKENGGVFIQALEGQVSHAIVLARSLSQLKANEEELARLLEQEEASRREAEAARRETVNILESIVDAFFSFDRDWRFTYINRKGEQLLQRKREDLIGKVVWTEFPEAASLPILAEIQKAAMELAPAVFEIFYPPTSGWLEASVYPSEEGLSAYVRDITERKREGQEREMLMEQLRNANGHLVIASLQAQEQTAVAERWAAEIDATFKAIGDAIIVYDPSGRIVRMNPAAEKMLGYSPHERELTVRERMEELDAKTLAREQFTADHPLVSAVLRGESVSGIEGSLQLPGGRTVWVSGSAGPIRARDGTLLGMVASLTDMTAKHNLDQQREDFMRAVSHDLRNPIQIVLGHAQLIQRFAEKPDKVRKSAEAVGTSAKRMNAMIQDLVDSIRIEGGQLRIEVQPVDLGYFVDDLLERAKGTLDTSRVRVDIPVGMFQALADPDRLERILVNLLTNALKYSSPGTAILARAERAGREVIISVDDQGPGIAPDDLPKIFDRFYRATDGVARADGIGLGLFVAKMLVHAHGGRMWAESELDRGSSFHFTLPLHI